MRYQRSATRLVNLVTFRVTIPDFTSLKEDPTTSISFIWDFGDGSVISGRLWPLSKQTVEAIIDESSGNATFFVQHTCTDVTLPPEFTSTIKVMDSNGGIGVDDVIMRLWDGPNESGVEELAGGDLIGGYAVMNGSNVTIALRLAGPITDQFQYRIKISGKYSRSYHIKYWGGKITGMADLIVEKGRD